MIFCYYLHEEKEEERAACGGVVVLDVGIIVLFVFSVFCVFSW